MSRATKTACPDCNVEAGSAHAAGCDVERCRCCGGQAISCDCPAEAVAALPRLPWTGLWPGEAECIEFGWFASWDSVRGWLKCLPTDPGAGPDLNRLYAEAVWNPTLGRFER